MSALSNALSQQWKNFLDLKNDVKPWLQIDASDTSRDVQVQAVIDGVCDWVQREIGKPIAPTRFDYTFDGNSGFMGAHIMLPYYPVLEIVSVSEWWGVSGPKTITEWSATNQSGELFKCTYRTGRLTRIFQGQIQRPWFPGAKNVEVVWVAGYNPTPPSIRLGSLEAIQWWWDNTQEVVRRFRPPSSTFETPGSTTQEFFGSVLPVMMGPILSNFSSVGIG